MKRTILSALALLLVATSPTYAGGTGQASSPTAGVTYSVEDAVFDGPDCAQVKWSATYAKPAAADITLRMRLEQDSSNSRLDEQIVMVTDSAVSGLVTGMLCVPNTADVSLGDFHVEPEVSVSEGMTYTTVPGQPVALTVTRNVSQIVHFRVRTAINMSWITGRAVALAPGKGTIGATGWVYFQRQRRHGWRTIGREWLGFGYGEFQETLWDPIPRGTKIRAILSECMWCTDARAVARVRAR